MGAYLTPKAGLAAVMVSLRAWKTGVLTSVNDGGTCIFRKGPQTGIALTGAETAIVFVEVPGLNGAETGAGSGNHWWREWELEIHALVPDDPQDPDGAEDARWDLWDELDAWLEANRTLQGSDGKAKVLKVTELRANLVYIVAGEAMLKPTDPTMIEQIYRSVDVRLSWKSLRGE